MKAIITLAALLVSTAALANDIDPNGFEKEAFISSASRADVKRDLQIAQAKGELSMGERGLKVIDEPSTKTRAQVAAEARNTKHTYGEASVE